MAGNSAPPAVSVIIPTYNCSAMLRLALQSVLRQDLADFEVWVIGDACTDDSAAIVAAFDDPRINWINLGHNSGSQSEPNNEGLRRARGHYVAYLGHDDLWWPWHLSRLVAHLQAKSADLVHGLCVMIAPEGVRDAFGPPHEGVTYDLHFSPPSSWLHRRSLITDVGWWRSPDSIGQAIDIDFMARVHAAHKSIEFAPTVSVLKFPSAWWKSYARTDAPQAEYLKLLIHDPIALRSQVLFDLALAYSRYHRQSDRNSVKVNLQQVGQAITRLLRSILKQYGRGRSPLAGVSGFLYHRRRRTMRHVRGLPPLNG